MKKKRTLGLLAAIFSLCLLCGVFAACGTEPVSLTIDQTAASVYVADTLKLTVTTSRDLEEDESLVWSSDKEDVATVKSGTVTGKGEGTAVITASVGDVSVSCTVTVLGRTVTMTAPSTTTINIMDSDKTLQLSATASDGGSVTWSSSDASVASVDSDGLVTAVSVGSATITAARGAATDSCTVTVSGPSDYYAVTTANNATVCADPGTWYWFTQGANLGDTVVAEEVYHANGQVVAVWSAIGEGKECALRYRPTDAECPTTGGAYTATFTLTLSTAGTVQFGPETVNEGGNRKITMDLNAGENEISIEWIMEDTSVPFTIRPLIYTATAANPLTMTVTDIIFTPAA